MTGSSFMETFVGLGAARGGRTCSRTPGSMLPAIVFIDEIEANEAIGARRGRGPRLQ